MEILLTYGAPGLAAAYLGTALAYGRLYLRRESAARWLAPLGLHLTVFAHLAQLGGPMLAAPILEWAVFPASDAAGSLSLLALSVALVYLGCEWAARSRATGFWMVGLAFFFQVFAAVLEQLGGRPEPAGTPDPLFATHRALTLAAFAACAVAAAYGFLHLNIDREDRSGHFTLLFGNLPRKATLERMTSVALWCAFAGLAAAFGTGVRWALLHLPETWFLEPKILALLFGGLLYGAILAVRRSASWRGRRTALLSLVGLVAILFSLTFFQIVAARL